MKYRLEPIVDLLDDTIIGQEILAGKEYCPIWEIVEWRRWYSFLEKEIPKILSKYPESSLFVNVDSEQLLDKSIFSSFVNLASHSDRIILEWTEKQSSSLSNDELRAVVDSLGHLGFAVAIDDIGSVNGIDGLGRSISIPAKFHKIDGQYFHTIKNNGPDHLRGLCHHLSHNGSKVIMEWIETEKDYRLALASGATYGQGRYWSKHGAV